MLIHVKSVNYIQINRAYVIQQFKNHFKTLNRREMVTISILIAQGTISYQWINRIKQKERCRAIAFNNTGSIMISGSNENIKVWEFKEGALNQLAILKGIQYHLILGLLFSRKNQCFVSGNNVGCIKIWMQGKNQEEWWDTDTQSKHTNQITCLLLNQKEDELISCCMNKNIFVWKINSEMKLIFAYELEKIHTSYVLGISQNNEETLLVTCGDEMQLVVWKKNNQWTVLMNYKIDWFLIRVAFISEYDIILQQQGKGCSNIYTITEESLVEKYQVILFNDNQSDFSGFPTIYNGKKQIIIQKSWKYVFILKKQSNDQFEVEAGPIDCETLENYGAMTENGDFLVIWNNKTNEYKIYKIE